MRRVLRFIVSLICLPFMIIWDFADSDVIPTWKDIKWWLFT
jgi:hypothetical protein